MAGALFFEDVGFGPELERGVGQAEAAGQPAHADQDRRRADVLGALDGRREDVVVREQLDRALPAPGGIRDEHDRVAALPPAADLGDPLGHAPGELDRGLTRDVQRPLP